ncbi:MAG TPA: ribosome silencing factor [Pyrinomonadaceae bacterium]|jgi:ribosome-associated protein
MKTTERETENDAATDSTRQAATNAPVGDALDERMLAALHAASDKKALDLVALDLRAVASFTDCFLIASGTNIRQVQAIADAILERLKEQGTRAGRVEGYNAAEWVLLDYGDFIVHIFEEKARRFYDLERLWRDAARIVLPPELRPASSSNTGGAGDATRGGTSGAASGDGSEGSLRNER